MRDSKVAAQQVLEIGSIGGEFSELLRAMRAQLPETARLQRRIADRDQAIVDARLKRLQAEEARRALSDTGGMADRVLASYAKRATEQPPCRTTCVQRSRSSSPRAATSTCSSTMRW